MTKRIKWRRGTKINKKTLCERERQRERKSVRDKHIERNKQNRLNHMENQGESPKAPFLASPANIELSSNKAFSGFLALSLKLRENANDNGFRTP